MGTWRQLREVSLGPRQWPDTYCCQSVQPLCLLGEGQQKSLSVPGDSLEIEPGAAAWPQKVMETQLGLGLSLGTSLLVVSPEGSLALLEAQCPSPCRWACDQWPTSSQIRSAGQGVREGAPPGTGSCLLPPAVLLTAHPATGTSWTKALVKGKRVPCGKGQGYVSSLALTLVSVYHLEQDGLGFKTVFFKVQLTDQPVDLPSICLKCTIPGLSPELLNQCLWDVGPVVLCF